MLCADIFPQRDVKGAGPLFLFLGEKTQFFVRRNSRQKIQNEAGNPTPSLTIYRTLTTLSTLDKSLC